MKKFISTLVAIATLANAGAMVTSASATDTTVKGDINKDGKVDYYDIVGYLQNYAIFLNKLSVSSSDGVFSGEPESEEFKAKYEEWFNFSDEEYELADLNADGKVNSKDAVVLMSYFIDVKAGYTGELSAEPVLSYYGSISQEQKEKFDKEQFNEMHALGLVRTEEEIKEEQEKIFAEKASKKIYTKCDLNNDGVFDQKDVELMKKYKVGDANNDGYVDSKDAVEVLSNYAKALASSGSKNSATSSDATLFVEDVNGDGVVDSKDAVGILKSYAESLVNNR